MVAFVPLKVEFSSDVLAILKKVRMENKKRKETLILLALTDARIEA